MFFTRQKIGENIKLPLYGKGLERIESFQFLGVFWHKAMEASQESGWPVCTW